MAEKPNETAPPVPEGEAVRLFSYRFGVHFHYDLDSGEMLWDRPSPRSAREEAMLDWLRAALPRCWALR